MMKTDNTGGSGVKVSGPVDELNPKALNEAGEQVAKEAGNSGRVYKPSPKHDPNSGWGSPNPIPNQQVGQELLDSAYSSSKNKQLYNYYEGQLIKYQPDRHGEWHAYLVKNTATEVPADVLRQMLKEGKITKVEYTKFINNR